MVKSVYSKILNKWLYGADIDDISNGKFTEGHSVVFQEGYDDPTYLTFKIEFGDWGASVLDRSLTQPNTTSFGLSTTNYDELPLGLLNCPYVGSENEEYYWQNNATGNADTFNNTKMYSAFQYLRSRNEDTRAKYLFYFVNGLYEIQKDYPFIFKKISGLQDLEKVDPTAGQRLKTPAKIKLECYDGLNMKMKTLFEFYRKATWDDVYQRWILPENMRQFKMIIYVFERRTFQDVEMFSVDDQKQTLMSYSDLNAHIPVKAYECSPCEFNISDTVAWKGDYEAAWSASNEETTQLSIEVKNVKTYFKNGLLSDTLAKSYDAMGKNLNDLNNYNNIEQKIDSLMIYDLVESIERSNNEFYDSNYITNSSNNAISNLTVNGVKALFLNKNILLENEDANPAIHSYVWGHSKGGAINKSLIQGISKKDNNELLKNAIKMSLGESNESHLKDNGRKSWDDLGDGINSVLQNSRRLLLISGATTIHMLSNIFGTGRYISPYAYKPIKKYNNGFGKKRVESPKFKERTVNSSIESPEFKDRNTDIDMVNFNTDIRELPEQKYTNLDSRELVEQKYLEIEKERELIKQYFDEIEKEREVLELKYSDIKDSREIPEQEFGKLEKQRDILEQKYLELDEARDVLKQEYISLANVRSIDDQVFLDLDKERELSEQAFKNLAGFRNLYPQYFTDIEDERALPGQKYKNLEKYRNIPVQHYKKLLKGRYISPQRFKKLEKERSIKDPVYNDLNDVRDIPEQTFETIEQERIPNIEITDVIFTLRSLPKFKDMSLEDFRDIPEEKLLDMLNVAEREFPTFITNKSVILQNIDKLEGSDMKLLELDKDNKSIEDKVLEMLKRNQALAQFSLSNVDGETADEKAKRLQNITIFTKEFVENADNIKKAYISNILEMKQELKSVTKEIVNNLPINDTYVIKNGEEPDNINSALMSQNDIDQIDHNMAFLAIKDNDIEKLSFQSLITMQQEMSDSIDKSKEIVGLTEITKNSLATNPDEGTRKNAKNPVIKDNPEDKKDEIINVY